MKVRPGIQLASLTDVGLERTNNEDALGYWESESDEEFLRKLVRTILERWGFQVVSAATGEEALSFYREHASEIDLVLLDYTMPGWNGLQVLGKLQEVDPDVRVIFSSGNTLQSEPSQLLAAGAEAFVAKPYRPEELVARIREVLDKNARRRPALLEAQNV